MDHGKKLYQPIETVYTITVEGELYQSPDPLYFEEVVTRIPITLSILRDGWLHEIVCRMNDFEISCGDYLEYRKAVLAMRECMKLAMKGELIYLDCWCCSSVLYYPTRYCACGQSLNGNWMVKKPKVTPPKSPVKVLSKSAPELGSPKFRLKKSPSVRGLNLMG